MTDTVKLIRTKDHSEIIFLTVKGHTPVEIKAEPVEAPKYLAYYFLEEVAFHQDALARGVKKELLVDFKDVQGAQDSFKSNIHRYLDPYK